MPLSQIPDVFLALSELLSFDDVSRLAIASVPTLHTLEAANRFLSSLAFPGMELFGWRPFKGALLQQLQESIQPQLLLNVSRCAHRTKTSSVTAPMPMALETSGRFFVKFWVSAGKAWNGCPSVGVVDAAEVRQDPSKLWDDMSRPKQSSDTFGISCNPYTGKIHTSHTSKIPKKIQGSLPVQGTISPRSWCADVVGWQSGESATRGRLRASIEIGMLISNGTLEFMREGPDGWERSGVVWDQLPAKILCCAFLFNFVGEAIVSIEEVRVNNLPRVLDQPSCPPSTLEETVLCTQCGKLSSWTGWPLA